MSIFAPLSLSRCLREILKLPRKEDKSLLQSVFKRVIVVVLSGIRQSPRDPSSTRVALHSYLVVRTVTKETMGGRVTAQRKDPPNFRIKLPLGFLRGARTGKLPQQSKRTQSERSSNNTCAPSIDMIVSQDPMNYQEA